MQRTVYPQYARVSQIKIEIGAGGLGAKMHFPVVAGSQRDGEVGIQERKRLLLVSLLEIDPGIFRFNVRETWSAAGIALAGGSIGNIRRLDQNGTQVPLPIGVADEI